MLEKQKIIEILNDWNYWNQNNANFVYRTKYADKIESFRESGEIIAVIGARRSGKSTLLKQEIMKLTEKYDKKQILFINFEDPRFSQFLNTDLLDKIFNTYKEIINPDKEIFLFLDEIQNIPLWERWVRTKHELRHATIYITGSSSKLLESELGTSLSGRYLTVDVWPLSFKEFLFFKNLSTHNQLDIIKNKTKIIHFLNEYLEYGGFPRVTLLPNHLKKEELRNYFQSILLRDIVSRHNLKSFLKIEQVSNYLLSNISKQYSSNKIKNTLGISIESTLNYISYLKEAFLVFELKKFNYSVKKQISSKKKIYCVDLGLVNVAGFRVSQDTGRILENLVFLELSRKQKEIYYFSEKKECDFVIKEGNNIIAAIQVCTILNKENRTRELEGLKEAIDYFKLSKGIIITEDQEETINYKGKKIQILPIWKWLLN